MAHVKLRSQVTFKVGPLKGMDGVVVGSVGLGRFLVLLDFFRCKATVEVDEADLLLADKSPRRLQG